MNLNEEEYADVMEEIFENVETEIDNQLLRYSNATGFSTMVIDACMDYLIEIGETQEWFDVCDDSHDAYLRNMVQHAYDTVIHETMEIPTRQTSYDSWSDEGPNVPTETMAIVNAAPIQKQRSPEWYETRRQLFSASNLSKLFASESQYNSLIYEKCKPIEIRPDYGVSNDRSPMNWGIKYEPVTVMIYEDKNHTQINTNYGCIPHPALPIGASPDGIVNDKTSSKYGRMIEIKNIYNREITGIPSEEYWVQMQAQMETCDLPYCDFVETRIKEYESQEAFLEGTHEYKGIILFLLPAHPSPSTLNQFVYMPVNTPEPLEWLHNQQIKMEEEGLYVIYEKTYWYLDEYSCVLVKRNAPWFAKTIPIVKEAWDIVVKERVEGYEHRAPQRRVPKFEETLVTSDLLQPETNDHGIQNIKIVPNAICLIKLDENGNVFKT